ncbi:MAG TPA: hypothetical protein VJI97_02700 [Candidatus Nanoarchaeia archaeon]|nr:hypothetical protein [Candidatus Nanoarchaeia archaeon]
MGFMDNVPMLKKMVDIGYAMMFVIIISAVVGLVLAFPVMWLWNFIFGQFLKIDVLQAWALNLLVGILFGQRTSSK